jgi:hypothetical protein
LTGLLLPFSYKSWYPSTQTKNCNSSRTSSPTFQKKDLTVVGAKKIAQLEKKWQRLASIRMKRLTITVEKEAEGCSMMVTGKGHCVMYTTDGTRFEVPLAYLGTISPESPPYVSGGVYFWQ